MTTRGLLPKCGPSFFDRFSRLTDVQNAAIPAILAGGDVMIVAATASGKTEAYAAPIAERIVASKKRGGARAIIVVPTRALANDLKRRLEGPFESCQVTLGRYTGEHKERSAGRLREVVITTPEALDSLLSRRRSALANVDHIVIDEVHVLDGTPRGDQLRILLHRLSRVVGRTLRKTLVSATVDDPPEMAARYADAPTIVRVDGSRRIVAKFFLGAAPDDMRRHIDELGAAGLRKILVFCRSRNEVEELTRTLRHGTLFGDSVFPHHGSLSQAERERTERGLLAAPNGVAVSTMTLELGIDIGSIDYVLLFRPPADVAGLMQRMGRGGRRGDTTRVGCVCASASEERLYRFMLRCARDGRLHAAAYGFRPGVLVQQAMVLAGDAFVAETAFAAILPPKLQPRFDQVACRSILAKMSDDGLGESPEQGRFVLSDAYDQQWLHGKLHANIGSESTIDVVDRLTGDVVGSMNKDDIHPEPQTLGGKTHAPVAFSDGRLLVDRHNDAAPPRFVPRSAPRTSLAFAAAFVADAVSEMRLPPLTIPWTSTETDIFVLHGLGSVGALLLAKSLVFERSDTVVLGRGAFGIAASGRPSSLPRTPEVLERLIGRQPKVLARAAGMGPFHNHLPEAIGDRAVREVLEIDRLIEILMNSKLVEVPLDRWPDWLPGSLGP